MATTTWAETEPTSTCSEPSTRNTLVWPGASTPLKAGAAWPDWVACTQEDPPVAFTVTWKLVEWTVRLAALGDVVVTVRVWEGAPVVWWPWLPEPDAAVVGVVGAWVTPMSLSQRGS